MAILNCGARQLDLRSTQIMGILNVTPDSFSDGGQLYSDQSLSIDRALKHAEQMVAEGATIIDIGGESTRPGADPVSLQEEMDRVLPVLERLSAEVDVVTSIDTSSPELMRAAASLGAGILNDVRALGREGAIEAAASTGLPVCVMHMQGSPATMQRAPSYSDVVAEVQDLVDFAVVREHLADLIKVENFPSRVVHNDTKLNNVLLHKTTGEGMCVVDLDTVMTGCVLHDFGDLVRTAACSALEDEPEVDKVFFLPKIFGAIVEGYLKATSNILESSEIEHLAVAPQVITYELGLRFLTDYLEGDVYFKVKRPEHNLDRVRAQFKLLASMEEHFEQAKQIVDLYSRPSLSH